MRFLRIPILLPFLALGATTAWGQFGRYGSPEVLRLPQTDPYGVQANPSVFPFSPAATNYEPATAKPPRPLIQAAAADSPSRVPPEPAPPRPQGPSVVEQLLNESGGTGGTGGTGGGGCARCDVPGGTGWGLPPAKNCFSGLGFGGGGYSPWYASASALVMGRNNGNRVWTSYETGNSANQLCNTQDIRMSWGWGGEITFGRRFCAGECCSCSTWALEATYWALAFSGSVSCTHENDPSTPLTFGTDPAGRVEFGVSAAVNWFDNAEEHRLSRRNEFHNLELNLVRSRLFSASDPLWDVDWSLGVRFFRFEERLIFSTLAEGGTWGGSGADEAYLNDWIANNLVGFQFGFDADYHVYKNLRLFVLPKVGIYNNHIQHYFQLYLGDGTVATQTGIAGETYPVRSSTDVFSVLTQIDVGLEWQFAQNWGARLGYRLVAVTGVGLSDNQIPPYIIDIPEIRDIDTNGELLLHGAFFGVTYNY